MFNIIVTVCHMVAGVPAPVCHEEVAFKSLPVQACTFAQVTGGPPAEPEIWDQWAPLHDQSADLIGAGTISA